MRNSECVIKNGATAPHTAAPHIAARMETLLSGRVMREYRSALTTPLLPRRISLRARKRCSPGV